MNRIRVLAARRSKYRSAAVLLALAAALPSACTFDPSNRCGPNELLYGENLRCVCDTKSAMSSSGCIRCGEHEVPSGPACICEAGYTRLTAGGACETAPPTPVALGAECSTTKPCTDPVYNHCELQASGGYCTNANCSAFDDCLGGYACDRSVSPSICRRPPLGLSKSCTSDTDCVGGEATYCDLFVSHTCLVQGCTVAPNNCFSGWDCCDLSTFGVAQPICVPAGGCPT